ncbi:hypothetical protein BJF90_34910 [Pseudonocardia sp. CNS-004]|nr:hypothetical protein BJF90_34910 [Pseudonocardia sp. CNS-004]
MIGRLPVRPHPMRRGHAPDRRADAARIRFGLRPLSLVFRRPPTAQAPPPVAGSSIEVSVHFAVLLHRADRLRAVVQRAAAPVALSPIALRLPSPPRPAQAPLMPAPRPDPVGLRLAGPDAGPAERGLGVIRTTSIVDKTVIRIVRLIERTLRRADAVAVVGPPRSTRPGLAAAPARAATPAPPAAMLPLHRRPDGADLGPDPARRPDRTRRGPGRPRPGADLADTSVVMVTSGRALRRLIATRRAWSRAARATTGPTGLSAAAARPPQAGTIRPLRAPQAGPEPTTWAPCALARRILLHRRPGASDPVAGPGRAIRPVPAPVPDEVVVWATRPVTRIHRTVPETPAGPRTRSVAPAAGPRAPSPPPFDLDQLDRDLWRRFEKRIRVEQQRRGRG